MGPCSIRALGRFDRDVAALLIEVFRPRLDLLACRIDDEDTATRLSSWERARFGARGRVWRVGDWRPAGPRAARRQVTIDDLAWHVAGVHTLGVYPMHTDGTSRSVSADFDDHRGAARLVCDPGADCDALRALLEREGVAYLTHRSRGGRGWWVHLLLPDGVRAAEARAVLHGMLAAAGVRSVRDGGSFDSLFPKQDEPSTRGPGSLFCLPLNRRWLAADPPGGGFDGVDPGDFEGQVYHLWKARRVEATLWHSLVLRFARPRPSPRSSPCSRTKWSPGRTECSLRNSSANWTSNLANDSVNNSPNGKQMPRASTGPRGGLSRGAGGSVWEIALRRAGRLGRPLGGGRYALLCPNDAQHTVPDGSVENARGSCVLFPPTEAAPDGRPWCAHAHCARQSIHDWIEAIGRALWDDAWLAARGMLRAGPWLLYVGGITTWYRSAGGVLLPSRRDRLCEVPLWIAEDAVSRGRPVRVMEAIVRGRTMRLRVRADRFATLSWLSTLGVEVAALAPWRRAKLVEAIERLSEPVPKREGAAAIEQGAAQARADGLLGVLEAMRRTGGEGAANERSPGVCDSTRLPLSERRALRGR